MEIAQKIKEKWKVVFAGLAILLILIFVTPIVLEKLNEKNCEDQGGKWGRIGMDEKNFCNLPTLDGGKFCSDSSECEGVCLADSVFYSHSDIHEALRNGTVIYANGTCAYWTDTGSGLRVGNGELYFLFVD